MTDHSFEIHSFNLRKKTMLPNRPNRHIAPAASSLLLCCLLLGGCASEKALLNQTQPLQDRIDQVEHNLSSSNQATLRAAESRAEQLAGQQARQEQQLSQVQAALAQLQEQLKAAQTRSTDALTRLAGIDADMKARLDNIEKQLAVTATGAQTASHEVAERLGSVQTRLDMADVNDKNNDLAIKQRLSAAEDKLGLLSGQVQEALALAAKEIFLANGKEAFTVMLTEDKVLYPQNDPNLDPRDAARLNELAEKLSKLEQEYHLDIQGHTANNSTEDNNYSLGKARAEVVKRYLHEKQGISISRMSTISYGATKPLSSGNNRRIHIRVLVLK